MDISIRLRRVSISCFFLFRFDGGIHQGNDRGEVSRRDTFDPRHTKWRQIGGVLDASTKLFDGENMDLLVMMLCAKGGGRE